MKVGTAEKKSNQLFNKPVIGRYDQYFALDWSMDNATIARMRTSSTEPKIVKLAADVKELKEYASKFHGKSILCIEETTTTHWLYIELRDYFDRILVCDPYKNSLLGDGAKSDKIDAAKLCLLLRGGLLKEVFHCLEQDYQLQKVMSAYEDWLKFGVRFKNQKSALYRALGLNSRKDSIDEKNRLLKFVEYQQNEAISLYEEMKKEFAKLFRSIRKQNPLIANLRAISGIDDIWAVTIYSKVIDIRRFRTKYKYWTYCGLAKHDKESGGRSYGKRTPRYCRVLKKVYKSAAMAAINGNNDIRAYYEHLLELKMPPKAAFNAVARYIAKVTYGMLKNKTEYIPYRWRRSREEKPIDAV
jgi:transposase